MQFYFRSLEDITDYGYPLLLSNIFISNYLNTCKKDQYLFVSEYFNLLENDNLFELNGQKLIKNRVENENNINIFLLSKNKSSIFCGDVPTMVDIVVKEGQCHKKSSSIDILSYELEKTYQSSAFILPEYFVDKDIQLKTYSFARSEHLDQINEILANTGKLTFSSFMVLAALYVAPEDISNWSEEQKNSATLSEWVAKYNDNILEGPVVDSDDPILNYGAHPVCGAWYYLYAKKNMELNPLQSFIYSVFVSTYIWEYGIESFAETPSWQDLFITPVLGSILGEIFSHYSKMIENNHDELFGCVFCGKTAKLIMNPISHLVDGIERAGDFFGLDIGGELILANLPEKNDYRDNSIIGFKLIIRPQL